jgi:hypothetical protein
MKIHVVKDQHGRPLASFEPMASGPKLEPKLGEGHKVEELEVPEKYTSDLKVLYKTGTR